MSGIFEFSQKCAFLSALLVCFFCNLACDPCRQLAEKICYCPQGHDEESSEETRKQCISDLNLAPQLGYFKQAKKPDICKKALEECTCEDLNNKNDLRCGSFRLQK
jgi:hypothetical protein